MSNSNLPSTERPREPRWPALSAVLAIAALYYLLPEMLSAGPGWLLIVIVAVLSIPVIAAHRSGRYDLNQKLAYALLSIVTLALIYALGMLITAILFHRITPIDLFRSAAVIWTSNILLFASWYWRLDAGGPHIRPTRVFHLRSAFLFPQMILDAEQRHPHWTPHFVDYLFLAFNTSTAFSPTDVPVLSRWAKVVMMVQSSISLTTLAIVAARAVNVL